jgi:hypothetical protein
LISVVLYGRNDSYGYNLHKRGALSLNCIAEIMDQPDDEILFVDWNTPDDFPTFPEAIADTLTRRARQVLRILRVRPSQHAQFARRTHLVALEPPARNVAVRRSNPANRWVLSTNTDMIFVPRRGRSLSSVVGNLSDGYYHLPRFELPETLWEGLDRQDPSGTIARIGAWAQRFHLNEIVTLPDPAVRYDGPGDFQLILRSDLFDMHGFDERMLLGWHVDSNIAVRLGLRHGTPGDVVDDVLGYHCDHTRQVTPAHKAGAVQNDWTVFVRGLREQRAPDQPDWGLGGEEVEEVRLTAGAVYVAALETAIPSAMPEPREVAFAGGGLDRTDYDPDHVAPFVVDAVCSMPREIRLGWVASTPALLARFAAAWAALGFTHPVRSAIAQPGGALPPDIQAMLAEVDVLVFDFAMTPALHDDPGRTMLDDPAIAAVAAAFKQAAQAEQSRMASHPPRRFICVNAVANSVESLVLTQIGAPTAPYSTRLRQGFVKPSAASFTAEDVARLLATATPAAASETAPLAMETDPPGTGLMTAAGRLPREWKDRLIRAGLLAADVIRAVPGTTAAAQALTRLLPRPSAEVARRYHMYHATGLGRAGTLPPVSEAQAPVAQDTRGTDVLPLMTLGPAGKADSGGVTVIRDAQGFVFYGPFLPLAPGIYRVHLRLRLVAGGDRVQRMRTRAVVDVVDRARILGITTLAPGLDSDARITFRVPSGHSSAAVEIRLRKPAGIGGEVQSLRLERVG